MFTDPLAKNESHPLDVFHIEDTLGSKFIDDLSLPDSNRDLVKLEISNVLHKLGTINGFGPLMDYLVSAEVIEPVKLISPLRRNIRLKFVRPQDELEGITANVILGVVRSPNELGVLQLHATGGNVTLSVESDGGPKHMSFPVDALTAETVTDWIEGRRDINNASMRLRQCLHFSEFSRIFNLSTGTLAPRYLLSFEGERLIATHPLDVDTDFGPRFEVAENLEIEAVIPIILRQRAKIIKGHNFTVEQYTLSTTIPFHGIDKPGLWLENKLIAQSKMFVLFLRAAEEIQKKGKGDEYNIPLISVYRTFAQNIRGALNKTMDNALLNGRSNEAVNQANIRLAINS